MSVDCVETDFGGFGELVNPIQWPQLRKRRRHVLTTVALLRLRKSLLLRPIQLLDGLRLRISEPLKLLWNPLSALSIRFLILPRNLQTKVILCSAYGICAPEVDLDR